MLEPVLADAETYARAIVAHDAAMRARGLEVWVGNEPTFTRKESSAPEWLTGAVGGEKLERARQVLLELAAQSPHAVTLRCLGRRYPGETEARFSFGLYALRSGARLYAGPPDPWLSRAPGALDLARFQAELAQALSRAGLTCRAFDGGADRRIVLAQEARPFLPEPGTDPRLLRGSIHTARAAEQAFDELAAEGLLLLILRINPEGDAELELPRLPGVDSFRLLLQLIGDAANAAELPALVLCGAPPPVDAEVSFLTVTPDPAVVELNMPPCASVAEFLSRNREAYAAAGAVGLSPYRLRHNGVIADSGGAGQITFGGPSPLGSPFLRVPALLPRLLRYALRHPAISYLFAHDYVGPSGQSVRPDERSADALKELRLAFALLDAHPNVDPATLWLSLAPCLTDSVGNAHRAELNVEKMWNPAEPGRGQLGLVELRALRMQDTPERAAALAALVRAIIGMLMLSDYREDPPEHGPLLHDRFALPFFLLADLEEILEDLARAGLGLGAPLEDELRRDGFRQLARVELAGVELSLRRGLEFWPLVGDATLQQGTSRLVDASTARLELALRPLTPEGRERLAGFELRASDHELPLRAETDARGPARVFGLRYRSFRPIQGLHPTLDDQCPLRLSLSHPELEGALELVLYDWKPDGGAYPDLPEDLAEAERRRRARCIARPIPRSTLGPARPVAARALTAHSLDLRYPAPR